MQNYKEISNLVKDEVELLKREILSGIDISERILGFLQSPSKHIRPVLSFLYLKAYGKNVDEVQIKYQSAIELVHNASLIHDDVIDESEIRRGENSLNKDLGNKIAVISGDYLLSAALQKVITIGSTELIEMFCKTLKSMTIGELKQNFSRFKIPSLEEYIEKTKNKTANLFDLSLKGSLKIAEYEADDDFAQNFGIVFQIKDDLVNCNTSQTDIKDGIYTAPVIFSNGIEITNDGLEKTRDLLDNYVKKAEKSLLKLKDNIYKTALIELVRSFGDE